MDKEEYRKSQEEAMENRFGYYREYTTEKLEQEQEQILSEIEYLNYAIKNKRIYPSSDQESEFKNSDLLFERDKLKFIEKVLEERNKKNIKSRR